MIISNTKGSFGARIAIVKTDSFTVSISTAKEGLLKGLSTMIFKGHFPDVSPLFKIIYKRSIHKGKRQDIHDTIVALIDDAGSNWVSLEDAIVKTARFLGEKDYIIDMIVL